MITSLHNDVGDVLKGAIVDRLPLKGVCAFFRGAAHDQALSDPRLEAEIDVGDLVTGVAVDAVLIG